MKLRLKIATGKIATGLYDGWWDDAEISDAVYSDLIKKSELYSVSRRGLSMSISYSSPISFISIYKDIEDMKVRNICMIIRNRND